MTTTTQPTPKTFPLGQIIATPGALELGIDLLPLLRRHARGDWGEMCEEDLRANDEALLRGGRLFSGYTLPGGRRLWIITEADRSVTTFLLPEEY
ncbi:MAG: hypothetical protein JXP73_01685 [Deltaproteobacteria bacterium]|nr:hypothetical protein [Deltaproteobacteria bacterium]